MTECGAKSLQLKQHGCILVTRFLNTLNSAGLWQAKLFSTTVRRSSNAFPQNELKLSEVGQSQARSVQKRLKALQLDYVTVKRSHCDRICLRVRNVDRRRLCDIKIYLKFTMWAELGAKTAFCYKIKYTVGSSGYRRLLPDQSTDIETGKPCRYDTMQTV